MSAVCNSLTGKQESTLTQITGAIQLIIGFSDEEKQQQWIG